MVRTCVVCVYASQVSLYVVEHDNSNIYRPKLPRVHITKDFFVWSPCRQRGWSSSSRNRLQHLRHKLAQVHSRSDCQVDSPEQPSGAKPRPCNALAFSITHSLTHSLAFSRTHALTHALTYSLTRTRFTQYLLLAICCTGYAKNVTAH